VYHYIQTEPELFTVGTGTPRSQGGSDWYPESDHATAEEAARRVAELNGGGNSSCDCAAQIAELRREMWALKDVLEGVIAGTGRGSK
jgi:hypothetical protein